MSFLLLRPLNKVQWGQKSVNLRKRDDLFLPNFAQNKGFENSILREFKFVNDRTDKYQ